MRYCVNCGNGYVSQSAFCSVCYSTPDVYDRVIDMSLAKFGHSPWETNNPPFGYKGEKAALVISLMISAGIALALGVISLGLFIGLIAVNILYLIINSIVQSRNIMRISNSNQKNIYNLARVAAFRLKVALPPIYVVQDQKYNAYTAGFFTHGFIVLHSSIIEELKPDEILFILGHELGHIKKYHTTWLTLLAPARVGSVRFVLAPLLNLIMNIWSVKAEYTADQAGFLVCKDVRTAVRTLLKLSSGSLIEKEVDIDAWIASTSSKKPTPIDVLQYLNTHPFLENRVRQLVHFAKSIDAKIIN